MGEAGPVSGASELAVVVVSGRRAWPRVLVTGAVSWLSGDVAGDNAVDAEAVDEPVAEEPDPPDPPPESDVPEWVTDGAVVTVWPEADVVLVTGVVPVDDVVSCEAAAREVARLEAPDFAGAGAGGG